MTTLSTPTLRPKARGALRRGFTLIELMVVIVILGLLTMLVGKNIWNALFSATEDTARLQMRNLGAAIDFYKTQMRTLPRSLDDLTQADERTREPFIEGGKIPLDPWQQPYEYKIMDERRMKFEILSSGPDKLPGTDDDLYFPDRDAATK